MTAFDAYAAFYDLFYQEKDYEAESLYVDRLIKSHLPKASRLLEFGCGTGGHALEFVRLGYEVLGIDLSEQMIERANARRRAMPDSRPIVFERADLRSYRSSRKFDAIVSLFHVMSYLTANTDLERAFQSAGAHLDRDGLFIFDCWYGPGVLSDPPVTRVKEFENEISKVLRISRPTLHSIENVVDVKYTVFVEREELISRLEEVHRMRYFFAPEIAHLLEANGFELVEIKAWMEDAEPLLSSWNSCFIAKKCAG